MSIYGEEGYDKKFPGVGEYFDGLSEDTKFQHVLLHELVHSAQYGNEKLLDQWAALSGPEYQYWGNSSGLQCYISSGGNRVDYDQDGYELHARYMAWSLAADFKNAGLYASMTGVTGVVRYEAWLRTSMVLDRIKKRLP
jgi:hypothetical protein